MSGSPRSPEDHIRHQMTAAGRVIENSGQELAAALAAAARLTGDALARGNKVLLCGNGGSAADAQHIAAEFVGRFLKDRRALPAIALTTDSSNLTAIGNDYGFDQVFSRQVVALGAEGDVLIAISTSGRSPNIVAAAAAAREASVTVIALTGAAKSALADMADVALAVPSDYTPHIQQAHISLLHILCELVEQQLFGMA
jgi:D-sedoheptulose 7-phosphate isomerase